MKLYLIFLLCLVFPESGLSQNADGMISRPKDKSSTHNSGAKTNPILEKQTISCRYDQVGDFSEGLAMVEINGKRGYVDKNGCEVISCKYDKFKYEGNPDFSANSFSEGLARVFLNGKWGFIDNTGREVIPCKLEYAKNFCEGFAGVKLNGKWGFIDKTGRFLRINGIK